MLEGPGVSCLHGQLSKFDHMSNFFKELFLADISPFCGATDTTVLNFWWCLPWVSRPGWTSLIACFVVCVKQNPQIHLWCDTCWPLGSQHGCKAISIHILMNNIGGTRFQDLSCGCHTWTTSLYLLWAMQVSNNYITLHCHIISPQSHLNETVSSNCYQELLR